MDVLKQTPALLDRVFNVFADIAAFGNRPIMIVTDKMSDIILYY